MKKIISTNIKKELSKLINKKGMNLDQYFKKELSNSKFNITFQELLDVVKAEKSFTITREINNSNIIQIEEEFYKSKEFFLFEEELYNWNYMKTLFREELNLNILLIYKLIKDLGEVNYAEISNNLKRVMNIKLDIKQLSHYCKEIKLMNLIFSDAILTVSNEKLVKPKKIEYANLNKKKLFEDSSYILNKEKLFVKDEFSKENLQQSLQQKGILNYVQLDIDDEKQVISEKKPIKKQKTDKTNEGISTEPIELDMFNPNFVNNPHKILNLDLQENKAFLNLENQHNINKSFLENRFSYIIDSNNFANNILFHLELANHNENSGLTQNEINLVTGFMGREKSIGRILTNLKNANLIKNTPMRVGRKYEFLYSIKNRDVLPKYLFKICQYFKNKKLFEMQGNLKNKRKLNEPIEEDIKGESENEDLIFIDSKDDNIQGEKEIDLKIRKNQSKIDRENEANIIKDEIFNADSNLLSLTNPEFFKKNKNTENKTEHLARESKRQKTKKPKKKNKKNSDLSSSENLDNEDKSFSDYNQESESNYNIPSSAEKKATNKTKNSATENKRKTLNENLSFLNPLNDKSAESANLTYKSKYKYVSNSEIININPSEDVEFVDLNKQDFLFILHRILKEEKYKSIAKQYDAELHKDNFDKLNENKKQKRNILLDFFHVNSDILNLKSLSYISFNRYLFCLNKLHEFNLLLAINLKHLIINELEYKTGYSIDRKTLQKILNNLHKLELIKVMEYELIMKNKIYHYSNNREEIKQNKIIAVRRDVVENEDLFSIIEYLIKPRCQSKGQNSNMPGLSHLQLVKNLKVKSENLNQDEFIKEPKEKKNFSEAMKKEEKEIKEFTEEEDLDSRLKINSEFDFSKIKIIAKERTEKKAAKAKDKAENKIKDLNGVNKMDVDTELNLNMINKISVDDLIAKNLFGEHNSNIKIKSKENIVFKLVNLIDGKICKINETESKQRLWNNLKKLYFVKKNLNFIFESLDNDAVFNQNENQVKQNKVNLVSISNEKELKTNKSLKQENIANCEEDYFLNIFNQSIPKANFENNFSQIILNNFEKSELNFNNGKDIHLFKLVENYKTNDIILPNYLQEKLLKKANNQTNETIQIKASSAFDFQEKTASSENKKTPTRHLIYSSCLLSEKEIEEEKRNLYYFTTDNFIKECYKNSNLSLSESEETLAKKLFKNKKNLNLKKSLKENEPSINENGENSSNKFINESEKRIKINNEEKERFIVEFLKNKKKRDSSVSKKYTKLIDFNSVLSFIYFNPRTTLKKIKKVFKYNETFSDIIIYFAKMDLLHLTFKRNNLSKSRLSLKDMDMELQLDENITDFIEII